MSANEQGSSSRLNARRNIGMEPMSQQLCSQLSRAGIGRGDMHYAYQHSNVPSTPSSEHSPERSRARRDSDNSWNSDEERRFRNRHEQDHDDDDDQEVEPDGDRETSNPSTQCQICFKTLKNIKGLKKHMVMHEGGTVGKCPFCHKVFKHKNNIRAHAGKCINEDQMDKEINERYKKLNKEIEKYGSDLNAKLPEIPGRMLPNGMIELDDPAIDVFSCFTYPFSA